MEIKLTGHRICGLSDPQLKDLILNRADVELFYSKIVDEKYNPNAGVYAVINGNRIGWIPHAAVSEVSLASLGFRNPVSKGVECLVTSSYIQPSGYLGLIVRPKAGYVCPHEEPKTQPQAQEKQKMKAPSIQDIVTSNIQAASNAARLEVGSVANKQLVKIVAKRLPAQYGVMLNNPFGKLLLANAVMVAAKSMYPENKNLGSVSNAMVVDSYQELIKSVDISGIIDELMADTKVVASLKDEDSK